MTEWNEAQTKAITHKDGPMMVLAGPGSGRTDKISDRTLRGKPLQYPGHHLYKGSGS